MTGGRLQISVIKDLPFQKEENEQDRPRKLQNGTPHIVSFSEELCKSKSELLQTAECKPELQCKPKVF